ncbi:MAG: hypothetical protein H6543_00990 [Prevotellaceae bacterium]|nr:hypothetical protein [Prevotellaceae bacterium]
MKRNIITLTLLLAATVVSAQGIFDALRYADNSINGTARYMSMAGAFGALGGDASSIIDNPAGLAIYRSSEMTITGNFMTVQTNSKWDQPASGSKFNFNINNAALIFAYVDPMRERGLVASNFSFSYNRLKNFHRYADIRGGESLNSMTDYMASFTNGFAESALEKTDSNDPYDNINVPWLSELAYQGYLINPGAGADSLKWTSLLANGETSTGRYKAVESGSVDEFGFNYGANISNVFYLGAGFNLQSIDYAITSAYGETFEAGGNFVLRNNFYTTGVGFNFKFGAIVRPTSFMRLGLSLHTPTYYSMTDRFYADMEFDTEKKGTVSAPTGYADYFYRTPLKFQASVGFIIGKSAIISFDYLFTDYKGYTRLKSEVDETDVFDNGNAYALDNDDIHRYALSGHTFKAGAEYRLSETFAVRGGFAYQTASVGDDAIKSVPLNTIRTDMEYFKDQGSLYAAGGFGYRYGGFGLDLTYAYRQKNELFKPYETTELNAAKVVTNTHNVVLSLSYRF